MDKAIKIFLRSILTASFICNSFKGIVFANARSEYYFTAKEIALRALRRSQSQLDIEAINRIRYKKNARISQLNEELIYRNAFVNKLRKVWPITALTILNSGYHWRPWNTYLKVPSGHLAIGTIVKPRRAYQGRTGDTAIVEPGIWSAKEIYWKGFEIVAGTLEPSISYLYNKGVFLRVDEGSVGIATNIHTGDYVYFPPGTSSLLPNSSYSRVTILKFADDQAFLHHDNILFKHLIIRKNQIGLIFEKNNLSCKLLLQPGDYLIPSHMYDILKTRSVSLNNNQSLLEIENAFIIQITGHQTANVTHHQTREKLVITKGTYYFSKSEWRNPEIKSENSQVQA